MGDSGADVRGDMLCLVINSRVAERVLLSPDAVPEVEELGWTVENTGDMGRGPFWRPSIAVLGPECHRVLTSVLGC